MNNLTPAQLTALKDVTLSSLGAALRIGKLPLALEALRNPSKDRSPHTRFVIQTDGPAHLPSIRGVVSGILGVNRSAAPGTSWVNRRLVVGGGSSKLIGSSFDVRPMFPGADPLDQVFKLANFVVLTIPLDPAGFKVRLGGNRGDGRLYDLAYALRKAGNYVRVDPEIPTPGWHARRRPSPPVRTAPGDRTPESPVGLPGLAAMSAPIAGNSAPADHAWNLRAVALPASNSTLNNGGLGIRVGQVDSGTRAHPECDSIYAPLAQHGCTVDGENDPTDPLHSIPGVDQPAHGIATASVLASRGRFTALGDSSLGTTDPSGVAAADPNNPVTVPNSEVTGIANRCTVVPVRAIRSVWLNVSNIDLAEGVWHCVEQDVDVITMSIGGACHPWLERVISFAVFNNIIAVAAGGQYVPFVPAPAVYPDCIAATATTVSDQPWGLASRGPAIDIAAPGVGVWCADARPGQVFVTAAEGTSFSAPTVAGAAALWLRHHGGRSALVARYNDAVKLADVFRTMVANSARVPAGWDTSECGAGILNITNLLQAPLPSSSSIDGRDWDSYDSQTERETLSTQLGNPDENALLAALSRLFDTAASEVDELLEQYGGEVMAMLATTPAALEDLKQAVAAETRAAVDAAEEAVEQVIDAIEETCSTVLATVAGWLG